LAADRPLGSQSTLTAHTFYEGVRDHLVNAFQGPRLTRSLHIFNGGDLSPRGVGLSLARRFGAAVKGSVTYTYGRSWRETPVDGSTSSVFLSFREAHFHDI